MSIWRAGRVGDGGAISKAQRGRQVGVDSASQGLGDDSGKHTGPNNRGPRKLLVRGKLQLKCPDKTKLPPGQGGGLDVDERKGVQWVAMECISKPRARVGNDRAGWGQKRQRGMGLGLAWREPALRCKVVQVRKQTVDWGQEGGAAFERGALA